MSLDIMAKRRTSKRRRGKTTTKSPDILAPPPAKRRKITITKPKKSPSTSKEPSASTDAPCIPSPILIDLPEVATVNTNININTIPRELSPSQIIPSPSPILARTTNIPFVQPIQITPECVPSTSTQTPLGNTLNLNMQPIESSPPETVTMPTPMKSELGVFMSGRKPGLFTKRAAIIDQLEQMAQRGAIPDDLQQQLRQYRDRLKQRDLKAKSQSQHLAVPTPSEPTSAASTIVSTPSVLSQPPMSPIPIAPQSPHPPTPTPQPSEPTAINGLAPTQTNTAIDLQSTEPSHIQSSPTQIVAPHPQKIPIQHLPTPEIQPFVVV